MAITAQLTAFYGWRVVGAAFVLGVFGWGVGFYGPPVFLSAVHEARGWPLALVSIAITVHFLVGALTAAKLPAAYRRFGGPAVTKAAAASLGIGICGWAVAGEPWQLFAATLLSGAGWGAMNAAALNALVSPWFVRSRPTALAVAYNGGSCGGIIFSPLWVLAIGGLGFSTAAAAIGAVMILTVWVLADALLSRTPEQMGLAPDGDALGEAPPPALTPPAAKPLPGPLLWRDVRFLTLAAGMSLGMFAQIGLIAHLFSLLMPALGAQKAGLAMGLITATAMAGRTMVGRMMPPQTDRRLVACAGYATQLAGCLVLAAFAGTNVPLLLLGLALFGAGFGNANLLPPLIAQSEFAKEDVPRVVSLIFGMAQAIFAFAPAAFGLIRELAPEAGAFATQLPPHAFVAAAAVQLLAIGAFFLGRRR